MNELTVTLSFVAIVAIAVFALSPTPWVRALGLAGLFLLTASLLGTAAVLLWTAVAGPRSNSGLGNLGMAVLAIPFGLFGYFAAFFLREAWRYVPGVSPHRLTSGKLGQIIRMLFLRR